MPRKKPPEVIETKLGRQRAAGMSLGGVILVDPRQDSKEYLDTLIHEGLHEYFPHMSEAEVAKAARFLTRIVWIQGYRKVQK